MVIPTDDQVKQLVNYLMEQAKFHQWQFANSKIAGNEELEKSLKAGAMKKANLVEGWAMALPDLITKARQAQHVEFPT